MIENSPTKFVSSFDQCIVFGILERSFLFFLSVYVLGLLKKFMFRWTWLWTRRFYYQKVAPKTRREQFQVVCVWFSFVYHYWSTNGVTLFFLCFHVWYQLLVVASSNNEHIWGQKKNVTEKRLNRLLEISLK